MAGVPCGHRPGPGMVCASHTALASDCAVPELLRSSEIQAGIFLPHVVAEIARSECPPPSAPGPFPQTGLVHLWSGLHTAGCAFEACDPWGGKWGMQGPHPCWDDLAVPSSHLCTGLLVSLGHPSVSLGSAKPTCQSDLEDGPVYMVSPGLEAAAAPPPALGVPGSPMGCGVTRPGS